MVLIRSVAFNVLFYVNLLIHCIAAIPTLVMSHHAIVWVVKFWAHTNFWLLRLVCGIRCEFRGTEKIPTGALLIASKHQSLWETFALMTLFADPAYILKRELMWIPFYGWYAWKADMIPVNRGKRAQALADMTVYARRELNRGRQIIIFPEGTRRAPRAAPSYKFGVSHLYGEADVPCLPVALNSGLFWPRRTFRRYPGTIVVEILDPIAPGLSKQELNDELQRVIEPATARLVAEGEAELRKQGIGPEAIVDE